MKKAMLIFLLPLLAMNPVYAENTLHYNLVEFNESASVRVANDTLNVTLVITETAKNRQTASNTVTQRLNKVLANIKKHKSFESQLIGRRVYPSYDDKQRIIAWKDSAEIDIKSKNFNELNQFIADSQEDTRIGTIHYSVSPEKYAQAVEQASTQALKAFTKRAQYISQTLGFDGYKLVKLHINKSFQNAHDSFSMMPMAAPMRAKSHAEVMEENSSGEQEIRQTVSGSIQM